MKNIKDIKTKELFDQIYENVLDDREKAIELFEQLSTTLGTDPSHHNANGPIIAKYLERLNKSNDQLIKLAEILQHAELEKEKNKSKGLSENELDEIFNLINKNEQE